MINQNEKWEEKENTIQKKNNSKQRENVKCDITGEIKNVSKKKPENGIIERKKKGNSGVYIIKNKINGKFYLGRSKNIKSRFGDHKRLLRKNKHGNSRLQNAWNKYGEKNFEFMILEETEPIIEKTILLEEKYLKLLNPCDKNIGYNILNNAKGPEKVSHINNYNLINSNKLLNSKPVYQYDLNGKFIKEWKSMTDASIFYKCNPSSISSVCRRITKTCKNFVWRYKSEIRNKNNKIPVEEIRNFWIKPVLQYDLEGKFVKKWRTPRDACKELKIHAVDAVCRKERMISGGFIWRYENQPLKKEEIENIINQDLRNRTIYQFDLNGKLVKIWKNSVLIKKSGFDRNSIYQSCNGSIKTSYGFIWIYNKNEISQRIKEINNRWKRKMKRIFQYDLSGKLVRIWDNTLEVVEKLNIKRNGIYSSCNGNVKKYRNFIWLYEKDNIKDRLINLK